MKLSKTAVVLGTLSLLLGAAPAFAHAELVSSTPAAGAKASNVKSITLTFDDPLMAPLSGLDIVMGAMPGMAAMKISDVKVAVGPGGKSLVATLAKPLPVGSYDVNWHAVSDDNHRVTGKVSFTVK
jgi:methionine-rich copper-binding protein CopC